MSFKYYQTVKDKICLSHSGYSTEYLVELRYLIPSILATLPGIEIHLAGRADQLFWLDGYPYVVPVERYVTNKSAFAYGLEILYDARSGKHPIWKLIQESDISIIKYKVYDGIGENAYICPEGNFPNRNLTTAEIEKCRAMARQRGFNPVVIGTGINESHIPIDFRPTPTERQSLAITAGMVLGAETDMLFQALVSGIPTALVGDCLVAPLYSLMTDPILF